jgi:GNAT superfamily N-acetyltransferase
VLRAVTMDDAEAYTELRRMVIPYRVVTPAGTRHIWRSASPAARLLTLVAVLDGEVVGLGRASLSTWTSARGAGTAAVMVHPEHRERGTGARIYERLEEHLRAHGAEQVQGWANGGEPAERWCARQGFARTHEARFSRLELTGPAALPDLPAPAAGVSLVSWARVGPRGVYDVDAATMRDEPGDVAIDAVPYEEWLQEVWHRPETDREVSTAVLVRGEPVAVTMVEVDPQTRRMWSGGTGTLREHRGRGYAKLVKSVALRRAAGAGITTAYTSNDETNRPMLAVNEWLGYRACASAWSYVKAL